MSELIVLVLRVLKFNKLCIYDRIGFSLQVWFSQNKRYYKIIIYTAVKHELRSNW
jgi:hypothetical protein